MIVDVGFAAVVLLLVAPVVLVAVDQLVVVVLVGVPVRPMLPFADRQIAAVMVRDVVVIVGVGLRRMGVGRLTALSLGALSDRAW
jgi:hypothetical protein